MKTFFRQIVKVFIFIFTALRPVLLVALVIIILGGALYVYDQYRTYQEKRLGAQLIDRIGIEPICDEIISPNEKFSFKFNIQNKNNQKVSLKEVGIDINLLGLKENKFSEFIDSNPKSEVLAGGSTQLESIFFQAQQDIQKGKTKNVSLNFKANSKKDSGATSHTIVSYTGKIIFLFDHEITIETKCQFQVRYP